MSSLSAQEASALAAIASALTAWLTYRLSKMSIFSAQTPLLFGEYNFDDEYIKLVNKGNGAAFNIKLQKTNQHFVDYDEIVSYDLEPAGPKTIPAGDSVKIAFVNNGINSPSSEDRKIVNYSITRLAEIKHLGVIYEDIYKKKWISYLKVIKNPLGSSYIIETRNIKRFRIYNLIWDFVHTRYFYSRRKSRVKQYSKSQGKNE